MLSLERLRDVLHYDPETGLFTWLMVTSRRISVGRVSGSISSHGYRKTSIDGRPYYLHRLAWLYVYGEWPHQQIDHIDGNKLNNRIENLRDVSPYANNENLHNPKKHNSTGVLGVRKRGNKYHSRIVVNGIEKHLGTFPTAAIAHQAYIDAKRKYHKHGNL